MRLFSAWSRGLKHKLLGYRTPQTLTERSQRSLLIWLVSLVGSCAHGAAFCAARMGLDSLEDVREFSWRLVAMRRSCPWQLHPARIVSHSCRRSIRGHRTKWQMRNQNAMNAENLQFEVESSKPFVDFTRTQSTDIGTLPCRQETFTADMTSCRRSMSGSVHLLVSLSFFHRV